MRLSVIALLVALGLAWLSLLPRSRPSSNPAANPAGTLELAAVVPPRPAADALAEAKTAVFPACFVPNLGQWDEPAKFVHRQGAVRMFLLGRGFVIDWRDSRKFERQPVCKNGPRSTPRDLSQTHVSGLAVRMNFVDADAATLVGERVMAGHSNYFLGNDPSRWRTDVPRYTSVLCKGFYPGIDVRVRSAGDHPEYDVLLEPWADITRVRVDVEGVESLRIAADGALVMDTARGPITQPAPHTWQVGADGAPRRLTCAYRLLGPRRFGFAVEGWDGDSYLTIDPGLIFSTFIGGKSVEATDAIAVASDGVITVAGFTFSVDWPTTIGAYDRIGNGGSDSIVFQLDPTGKNLLNSTYVGGNGNDAAYAMHVDEWGRVSIAGDTNSSNYPATSGAYSSTYRGNGDVFVSRLDFALAGTKQLFYSSLIGGASKDVGLGVSANPEGVVTVTGTTESLNFPITPKAFDSTHNGVDDVFVTRLDPRRSGATQLTYSTLVGGNGEDTARAMSVDPQGVVTVVGNTASTNFPTTVRAFDTTPNGGHDVFLIRVDPTPFGDVQLVYSTLLGGSRDDGAVALHVDRDGVATLGGFTASKTFPTTKGAYDSIHHGVLDAFLSRVDVRQREPLVWSTMIGGTLSEHVASLDVDGDGVVTFGGACNFGDFPTTPDAYDRLWAGDNESIVARLDPRKTGKDQLIYSTYFGGVQYDDVHALAITQSGVAVTAGHTRSPLFPVTPGAFDTTYNGVEDMFVTVLDMNVKFYGDTHEISLKTGGTQNLQLNAPFKYRGMSYMILGSVTGTRPGIPLGAVHIPLNWDSYTRITMSLITPVFGRFRGKLDFQGNEVAAFRVPPFLTSEIDLTLNHVFIVLDAKNNILMASNPVPCRVR